MLAEQPEPVTRAGLRQLCRAHLLDQQPALDGKGPRWRIHDVIRLYALERLTDQQRANGFTRVLGHYRRIASLACGRFMALPGQDVPAGFDTSDEALGWVVGERAGLIAAVVQAATATPPTPSSLPLNWARCWSVRDCTSTGSPP